MGSMVLVLAALHAGMVAGGTAIFPEDPSMTFRLLGMSDEERLAFEEASGVKTEGARLIVEESIRQTEDLMARVIREVQEVVGPHGTITRVQAGGIRMAQGLGVAAFEDGILKTNIEPDGDFLAG